VFTLENRERRLELLTCTDELIRRSLSMLQITGIEGFAVLVTGSNERCAKESEDGDGDLLPEGADQ
jgi:hypothetical protein